jgi:tol-pal system protein YbgF
MASVGFFLLGALPLRGRLQRSQPWLLAASLAFSAGAAASAIAIMGCDHTAEEKQLDSMREEIVRVRESRDRADQTTNANDSTGRQLVLPEAYASEPTPRPPPPIVQLGQDGQGNDDSAEADPQDTTPRPTIRVFGSVRSGRNARMDDQIEETAPDDRGAASGSSGSDADARRAYDAALSLVNARRFDQGLDALAAFLVKWPDNPYADNATYWRGECYFARGDYLHASEQFEGVLSRFPGSEKAPDALLKLGMASDKLGRAAKAKDCFDRLVRQYPDSDAAHHVPSSASGSPPSRSPSPAPGPAPEEHR